MEALRRALIASALVAVTGGGCGRKDDKNRPQSPAHPDVPAAPAPVDADKAVATVPSVEPVVASLVDPLESPAALPEGREAWWYGKTALALTGRELSTRADAAELRALPRREFVGRLLAEPGFAERMLEFNLWFLGFREGRIIGDDGMLADDVMTLPAALSAAKALEGGGDYLTLFDARQPLYLKPLEKAELPDTGSEGGDADPQEPGSGSEEPEIPQETIRATLRPLIVAEVQALRAFVMNPDTTQAEYCGRLFPEEGQTVDDLLDDYGVPSELVQALTEAWFGDALFYCFLPPYPKPDLSGNLARAEATLGALFSSLATFDSATYAASGLAGIKAIDTAPLGLAPQPSFSQTFFFRVQNSSTNYNRRRAAYMLKRFFCDDLTPINQTIPDDHAGGRHASEPACQSCHYKLDPMAGYFRDKGIVGLDFSKAKEIIFDDQARADHDTYADAWRAPDGSGRTWDVGYVRSVDDSSLNSYGESLDDLFALLRTAPEPKRCLVRRMFERFNGEGQAIDPGWLDYLAAKFASEAETSSTTAVRNTVARLVLGNTFSEPDPISSQCYDRLPREGGTDAGPPCRVMHVLEKNCASCHGGSGGAGGLSLTTWIRLDDGGAGFQHVQDGVQIGREDTMQRIVDRLESGDRDRRMPLNQFISAEDRETIYLWAYKEKAR